MKKSVCQSQDSNLGSLIYLYGLIQPIRGRNRVKKLNICCGNYSREETIQGRKLFAEIRYSIWSKNNHCKTYRILENDCVEFGIESLGIGLSIEHNRVQL